MAQVYPERVPESVRDDPRRAAERDVYECLADNLDDTYNVFGWVAWVTRGRDGARDGEADFVVAHPDQGALVLEVKGGGIEYDAASRVWTSTDRHGARFEIRDPFEQARRNHYSLRDKLREQHAGSGVPFSLCYGVAFPDVVKPRKPLKPDAPLEILLCREDLAWVGDQLPKVFEYWRGSSPNWQKPGKEGIERLRALLARSFRLEVPMATSIAEDARRIIDVEEEQYDVLDGLARYRRALVNGGPGTGKTVLALEKARRLAAEDGFTTLLTCFNRPLAEYLSRAASGVPRLTVESLHSFCHRMAVRAGAQLPDPDKGKPPQDYFRRELPEKLVEALARLPSRFEAIVLDEGQDFGPDDRAAIQMALADPKQSPFYVFQDASQRVYRDAGAWPEADFQIVFPLVVNRRNTRAIHRTILLLGASSETRASGPEGRPVELIRAADPRAERDALSRALHRLIREEHVPPGGVAVLTSSRTVIPELAPDGRIGAFQITAEHRPDPQRVLVESITRFKGLERDVVVMAGLREVEYVNFGPLLCVGASRARAHLVVIGRPEVLERFEEESSSGPGGR